MFKNGCNVKKYLKLFSNTCIYTVAGKIMFEISSINCSCQVFKNYCSA